MDIARPQRRALILDFDGVIVETEKLHFDCWNAAFVEQFDIQLDGSYRQIVGLSLRDIYGLWCNATDGAPLVLTSSVEQALLDRKTELYYELGDEILEPVPGIIELIQWAHGQGWYVTIASRARRVRLLRTLEMLKMPVYFDLIMGTEDVVDPHTEQKVHTKTLTPFDIQPTHAIVIEDSASGVRNAKACHAGCVIGLTTSLKRDTLLAVGADHVVDLPMEVPKILISRNG
ncbi:MAG: HAD family phosphatase [Chloroflexota bacterium]